MLDEESSESDRQLHCVHPFYFFAEEVWLIIADKLPPVSLYSYSKSCTTFQNLLESARSKFLLPLVLPFLKWDFSEDKRDFLNCRLVSHLCKESIDNYCQDSVASILQKKHHEKEVHRRKFLQYKFASEDSITRFLMLMVCRPTGKDKNPFISRYVKFDDNDYQSEGEDAAREFWNVVSSLLQVFGKHIWFCKLIFRTQQSEEYSLRLIRRLFTLTPNLRVVKLEYKEHAMRGSDEGADGGILEELVYSCPIPSLWLVKQASVKYLPPIITKQVLRTFDTTQMEWLSVAAYPDCPEEVTRFPNLTYTNLSLYKAPALLSLMEVSWPLVEADLEVILGGEDEPLDSERISVTNLFDWLSRFGETLHKLKLRLSGNFVIGGLGEGDKLPIQRLGLHALRELKIETLRGKVDSLHFLHGLNWLERVDLMIGVPRSDEGAQLGKYVAEMTGSKIWEVCESLKWVTLNNSSKVFVPLLKQCVVDEWSWE